jgi:hypothetical protein
MGCSCHARPRHLYFTLPQGCAVLCASSRGQAVQDGPPIRPSGPWTDGAGSPAATCQRPPRRSRSSSPIAGPRKRRLSPVTSFNPLAVGWTAKSGISIFLFASALDAHGWLRPVGRLDVDEHARAVAQRTRDALRQRVADHEADRTARLGAAVIFACLKAAPPQFAHTLGFHPRRPSLHAATFESKNRSRSRFALTRLNPMPACPRLLAALIGRHLRPLRDSGLGGYRLSLLQT